MEKLSLRPQGPKRGRKIPKNIPNWPKSHFLPYNFSSIHQIFMKFCQKVETLVINIKVLLLTPKKLWFVSLGDFRTKNAPILGAFLTFVQNVIMFVFILVYYGAEFKFTGPNTWNCIIFLFWGDATSPIGSTKAHKKSQIVQNKTFCLITFHIQVSGLLNVGGLLNVSFSFLDISCK